MKHPKLLYGFVFILGLVFVSPLLSGILQGVQNATMILFVFFLSIAGTVLLISGTCGIGSQYLRKNRNISAPQPKLTGKPTGRHSKLYRLIVVLGTVFLGVFLTMGYWSGKSAAISGLFQSTPLAGSVMFIFLFGGTGLLTVEYAVL